MIKYMDALSLTSKQRKTASQVMYDKFSTEFRSDAPEVSYNSIRASLELNLRLQTYVSKRVRGIADVLAVSVHSTARSINDYGTYIGKEAIASTTSKISFFVQK